MILINLCPGRMLRVREFYFLYCVSTTAFSKRSTIKWDTNEFRHTKLPKAVLNTNGVITFVNEPYIVIFPIYLHVKVGAHSGLAR